MSVLYTARMTEAGSRKQKFRLRLDDWSTSDNDEENMVNGGWKSVEVTEEAVTEESVTALPQPLIQRNARLPCRS